MKSYEGYVVWNERHDHVCDSSGPCGLDCYASLHAIKSQAEEMRADMQADHPEAPRSYFVRPAILHVQEPMTKEQPVPSFVVFGQLTGKLHVTDLTKVTLDSPKWIRLTYLRWTNLYETWPVEGTRALDNEFFVCRTLPPRVCEQIAALHQRRDALQAELEAIASEEQRLLKRSARKGEVLAIEGLPTSAVRSNDR